MHACTNADVDRHACTCNITPRLHHSCMPLCTIYSYLTCAYTHTHTHIHAHRNSIYIYRLSLSSIKATLPFLDISTQKQRFSIF